MPMRILIVDDEHLARDRLTRMVGQFGAAEVVGEAANGLEAVQEAHDKKPDVVLLDIRMPAMDGIETARHLAAFDEPPAVIFCTAYEEHAIEAFDVQAVGYLVKPVRKERLREALDKARRVNRAQLAELAARDSSARSHISVRTHKGIELIAVDDIRYFQADQKYVSVGLVDQELIIDEPLRELEAEFGERFLRVHRNAIVAVRHLEALERIADNQYQIRLKGVANALDVSRRHLAAVRKFIKAL